MYKIPDKVVQFIEKTIQTWRVKLTAGGKSWAEVKILRGIFQGDALWPLLFVIAIIPLNHILKKITAGYKHSKSQKKINHLMNMDDIKLFAKNEKEMETLIQIVIIYSQDIGIEFGIEKCKFSFCFVLFFTTRKRRLSLFSNKWSRVYFERLLCMSSSWLEKVIVINSLKDPSQMLAPQRTFYHIFNNK